MSKLLTPPPGAGPKGSSSKRLLVLGGGPIGVELACRAVADGWAVTVVERGAPLAHVRAWGHVTLFSPWALNTTAHGLAILDLLGVARPDPNAFPTGHELVDQYLGHLWRWLGAQPAATLRPWTHAVAASRVGLAKGTMGGRKGQPFAVLVASAKDKDGKKEEDDDEKDEVEEVLESDALVDCSGNFGQRNWLGPGGRPALGERAANRLIHASIPDVAAHPARFLGKRILVVGGGYSAVTTIAHLQALAEAHAGAGAGAAEAHAEAGATTTVVWVTRRAGEVYARVANDSLPGRDRLALLGNAIATQAADAPAEGANKGAPFAVEHRPGARVWAVKTLASGGDAEGGLLGGVSTGKLAVTWAESSPQEGPRVESSPKEEEEKGPPVDVFDHVVAAVGYRPDAAICQELQVHYCYATEGPMKLAAALMATSGGGGGDCLAQVAPGPATLISPEPHFFVLGMKSYGRGSAFLLKIGHEQVDMAMGLLNGAQ